MNLLLVLLCLVTLHYGHGFVSFPRPWLSKRQVTADSPSVYDAITETLTEAKTGINSQELERQINEIASLAERQRNDVSSKDIDRVIDDIASQFDNSITVSALFDDALKYDTNKLNSGFQLLNGLVQRGKKLKGEGKPDDDVLGAIAKTAKAVSQIIKDIDEIVKYVERLQGQDPDQTKDGQQRGRRWSLKFKSG